MITESKEENGYKPETKRKRKRIALIAGVLIAVGLAGGYVSQNFTSISDRFRTSLAIQRDKLGLSPAPEVVVPAPTIRVDKVTQGTVQEIDPVVNVYYTSKLVVQDVDGTLYNVGVTDEDLEHIAKGDVVRVGLQLSSYQDRVVEDTILLTAEGTALHRNSVNKMP